MIEKFIKTTSATILLLLVFGFIIFHLFVLYNDYWFSAEGSYEYHYIWPQNILLLIAILILISLLLFIRKCKNVSFYSYFLLNPGKKKLSYVLSVVILIMFIVGLILVLLYMLGNIDAFGLAIYSSILGVISSPFILIQSIFIFIFYKNSKSQE